MTRAFEPGDPVLELAALGKGISPTVLEDDEQPWIRKAEQLKIDEVCTFQSIFFSILPPVRSLNHVPGAYMFFVLTRPVHQIFTIKL